MKKNENQALPKVPQQIGNPISENLQKLRELFPSAVKDGELDVEALREELGDFTEIQPGDEKYELNWAGKQAAKKKAFEPLLGKTLKYLPDDSKHPDTTENIYIEGDNLEALKLLRQNYYGAIKMIYIDPPYNTGKDFVYKDNFKADRTESDQAEGAISESGERLFKNEKSSNRFHANWLNMMYPRLRLSKDLLNEDGVIFISIDDNEVHNLREICDEIFGLDNFIGCVAAQLNPRGRHLDLFLAQTHESLVIYAKNSKRPETMYGLPKEGKMVSEYNRTDDRGSYRLLGLRNRNQAFNPQTRPNLYYPLYINPTDRSVSTAKTEAHIEEIFPDTPDGVQTCWTWSKDKVAKENHLITAEASGSGWRVYRKDYLEDENGKTATTLPKSLWLKKEFNNDVGRKSVKELLGASVIDFPKSPDYLIEAIRCGAHKDQIILDFFSGSATTAHAVMKLNAEDGSNRSHITVQLPEPFAKESEAAKAGYKTIAEIGKERIRRAGEKIVAELREKKAELEKKGELALDDANEPVNPYLANPDALDIGFKCFRIEETKINWLKKDLSGGELVDTEISDKDRLDFVPGFTDLDVVYEIMLRQSSIPLTEPITTLTDIGLRTYLYGESYLICLEEVITKEMVEKLAQLEPTPLKFIFRDSAFGKDIAFKDTTFRRLNAEIAKHTEGEETYTVEFI